MVSSAFIVFDLVGLDVGLLMSCPGRFDLSRRGNNRSARQVCLLALLVVVARSLRSHEAQHGATGVCEGEA